MPKNATNWIVNPTSTTVKKPAVWANSIKSPTAWYANTAMASVDTYDNVTDSYDGAGITDFDSYDGLALGQSPLGTKKPTVWANT